MADLARELAAHPRWGPASSWAIDGVAAFHDHPRDLPAHRTHWRGLKLLDPSKGTSGLQWVPDLADDATAGVLLGMLGAHLVSVNQQRRESGMVWTVRWRATDGLVHTTRHHDSLGEAAARAWLAVHGAGEGA